MSLRVIEASAASGNADTIVAAAKKQAAIDVWRAPAGGDGRATVRILVAGHQVQPLMDTLQQTLGGDAARRIILLPALATLPEIDESEERKQEGQRAESASREELYNMVAEGGRLDSTFLLLVVLSTLVAGIGLIDDNVAVIIGAMVIAPLLGPNLAFSFAVALGDRALMGRALRTNLAGLALTIATTAAAGFALPLNLTSHELVMRTGVSYDGIILALASGAAAALSLVSGLSSALVGVMVAVALLPPAATLGLMAGSGAMVEAGGAATLLGANLVCVNLAAQLVLFTRGVKPRTWWQKKEAQQSLVWSVALWAVLLVVLLAIIYVEHLRLPHSPAAHPGHAGAGIEAR
jgi:uncharacterized hydrophobic protein (TIGR00341 family)